jgi:hypothetical protein
LIGEVRIKPSSHASNGAAEPVLAVVLPRQHWPWRIVATEPCWQWRYRVDVGRGMTSLPNLAGDGAVEATLVMTLPRRRHADDHAAEYQIGPNVSTIGPEEKTGCCQCK